MKQFPVIDPAATGENIRRLRLQRGLSVRDLQDFFGFEEPQAIYKWQWGKSLPSVDNLYALSTLLDVPMDAILVPVEAKLNIVKREQQAVACCSAVFWCIRRGRYDNAPARSLAILSQRRRMTLITRVAIRKGETESNAPEGAKYYVLGRKRKSESRMVRICGGQMRKWCGTFGDASGDRNQIGRKKASICQR